MRRRALSRTSRRRRRRRRRTRTGTTTDPRQAGGAGLVWQLACMQQVTDTGGAQVGRCPRGQRRRGCLPSVRVVSLSLLARTCDHTTHQLGARDRESLYLGLPCHIQEDTRVIYTHVYSRRGQTRCIFELRIPKLRAPPCTRAEYVDGSRPIWPLFISRASARVCEVQCAPQPSRLHATRLCRLYL